MSNSDYIFETTSTPRLSYIYADISLQLNELHLNGRKLKINKDNSDFQPAHKILVDSGCAQTSVSLTFLQTLQDWNENLIDNNTPIIVKGFNGTQTKSHGLITLTFRFAPNIIFDLLCIVIPHSDNKIILGNEFLQGKHVVKITHNKIHIKQHKLQRVIKMHTEFFPTIACKTNHAYTLQPLETNFIECHIIAPCKTDLIISNSIKTGIITLPTLVSVQNNKFFIPVMNDTQYPMDIKSNTTLFRASPLHENNTIQINAFSPNTYPTNINSDEFFSPQEKCEATSDFDKQNYFQPSL